MKEGGRGKNLVYSLIFCFHVLVWPCVGISLLGLRWHIESQGWFCCGRGFFLFATTIVLMGLVCLHCQRPHVYWSYECSLFVVINDVSFEICIFLKIFVSM